MTILIKNIRFAGETASDGWIAVDGRLIAATGHGPDTPAADRTVDGAGALALPGVIDCHVHFREPGLTGKADMLSESRAAIAGGVTSCLEMPNTVPPTTSIDLWERKMAIAAGKSLVNYAFFIGATNDNIDELRRADYSRIPGIKLFMGSSTGNMLVDDDDTLVRIFSGTSAIVAVHAEDQDVIARNTAAAIARYGCKEAVPVDAHSAIRSAEACYLSSAKAVRLARKYNHRLHLCHISTARELELLQPGPAAGKLVTSEVSPHHLMWCDGDYARKGASIKMNPSVKSEADREALRRALASGLIDIVATDHAPHLAADKVGGALSAASGAPAIQHSLPWMLDNFDERLVEMRMCRVPAEIYRIAGRGRIAPGCFADITLVERCAEPYTVEASGLQSKCGWSPMCGESLRHRVVMTMVNGACVYRDGAFLPAAPAMGLAFGV